MYGAAVVRRISLTSAWDQGFERDSDPTQLAAMLWLVERDVTTVYVGHSRHPIIDVGVMMGQHYARVAKESQVDVMCRSGCPGPGPPGELASQAFGVVGQSS